MAIVFQHFFPRYRAWYHRLRASPTITPIFIGLAILFAINIIFIVDIELTLRQNSSHDESRWTFGQTLAILLLVLPLRDSVDAMLARREKARQEEAERREKAHRDELAAREKKHRDQQTASLIIAMQRRADLREICELVKNGADPNAVADGMLPLIHFGVAIEPFRQALVIQPRCRRLCTRKT
jgi:hypothetical protein